MTKQDETKTDKVVDEAVVEVDTKKEKVVVNDEDEGEDKEDKSDSSDKEEGDEEEDMEESARIIPALDIEKTRQVVSENVKELFEGQDLSEDFKKKVAVVYEAALVSRLNEEIEKLEEQAQAVLTERVDALKTHLVGQQEKYLSLAIEQWTENNQVALEKSLRLEILEGFFQGLHDLFLEHNIDLPEGKEDMLQTCQTEGTELKKQVNEATEKLFAKDKELTDLREAKDKEILELRKEKEFKKIAEGLTDMQAEKLAKLVEAVEAHDLETYVEKATIIRNEFMKVKPLQEDAKKEEKKTDAPNSLAERVKALNKKD